MTIFETIHTDDEVEDAVVATLRKWLPTYMSEVERQLGLEPPYYARPAESSYTVRADFDKFPEEMLPLVVVVSQGIDDDPAKDGSGTYRGRFPIGVSNICSSIDQVATRRYAYRMGAAIRAALVQRQSLDQGVDGDVRGIDWIGTRNNELPSEDERTIWACRQLFVVDVGELVTRVAGPVDPDPPEDPTEPLPDWPIAETVGINITKESIPDA